MFGIRRGLLAIILIWAAFQLLDHNNIGFSNLFGKDAPAVLTDARRVHILYGDQSGGGHLSGVGKPCKSEFPSDWTEEKITRTVEQIAANDNLNWKRQENGYYTVNRMVEDVRVRVVVDRRKNEIVTAYPVNIGRNPCPAPANDNTPD
jgi:hypothetical protein